MGMRRSIDTNTRRANSAGPAPPPNPAPHGEHHINAKIKLSPLDLWTVSKRFRTNCYLVPTSLEKGSKCNVNKKRAGCQGLIRSGIFFVLEGSHLHRPPYFVKPKLPGTEYFSEYSPLSLSSLNLHLIIILKRGRGASF